MSHSGSPDSVLNVDINAVSTALLATKLAESETENEIVPAIVWLIAGEVVEVDEVVDVDVTVVSVTVEVDEVVMVAVVVEVVEVVNVDVDTVVDDAVVVEAVVVEVVVVVEVLVDVVEVIVVVMIKHVGKSPSKPSVSPLHVRVVLSPSKCSAQATSHVCALVRPEQECE